jgi:hypothetical protein
MAKTTNEPQLVEASSPATFCPAREGLEVSADLAAFLHDAIAQRAFDLFLQRGQVHGHALDDWLRAEQELLRTEQELLTKRELPVKESRVVATSLRGSSRRSSAKR